MQKIGFKNSQNSYAQSNNLKPVLDKKKTERIQKVTRTVSAFAPAAPVLLLQNFFSNTALKKMFNVAKNLNDEEIKILNESANKVLKKANLEKLIDIKNITSKTKLSDFMQYPLTILDLQQVQQGANAFFDGAGSIYINKEIAPNLFFHEIGHAHNSKFSSFLKKIFPLYLPSQRVPFVVAFASLLLNEEKPKDGKELTKFQKAKNIFRKTLPFLAAASSLPMLLEEGMATKKGNKWAKELLDSALAKKVAKGYKFGFITYLLVPTSAFLISFLGMKYKDFLSERRNNKTPNAQPEMSTSSTK